MRVGARRCSATEALRADLGLAVHDVGAEAAVAGVHELTACNGHAGLNCWRGNC
jgi:hypothetical protein